MIHSTLLAEISKLTLAERILLVEEIWNSVAADSESRAITESEKEELDQRLAAYRRSPESGSTWEDVKARLQGLG